MYVNVINYNKINIWLSSFLSSNVILSFLNKSMYIYLKKWWWNNIIWRMVTFYIDFKVKMSWWGKPWDALLKRHKIGEYLKVVRRRSHFVLDDFRRHPKWRSDERVAFWTLWSHFSAHAKVDEFHFAACFEQNIPSFNVSVNVAKSLKIHKPFQWLLNDRFNLWLAERLVEDWRGMTSCEYVGWWRWMCGDLLFIFYLLLGW